MSKPSKATGHEFLSLCSHYTNIETDPNGDNGYAFNIGHVWEGYQESLGDEEEIIDPCKHWDGFWLQKTGLNSLTQSHGWTDVDVGDLMAMGPMHNEKDICARFANSNLPTYFKTENKDLRGKVFLLLASYMNPKLRKRYYDYAKESCFIDDKSYNYLIEKTITQSPLKDTQRPTEVTNLTRTPPLTPENTKTPPDSTLTPPVISSPTNTALTPPVMPKQTPPASPIKKHKEIENYINSDSTDPVIETQNIKKFKAGIKSQERNLKPDSSYRGVGLRAQRVENGFRILDVFSPNVPRFKTFNQVDRSWGSEITNPQDLLKNQAITHACIPDSAGKLNPIELSTLSNEEVAGIFHSESEVVFKTDNGNFFSCDNTREKSAIFSPTNKAGEKPEFSALSDLLENQPALAQKSIERAIERSTEPKSSASMTGTGGASRLASTGSRGHEKD